MKNGHLNLNQVTIFFAQINKITRMVKLHFLNKQIPQLLADSFFCIGQSRVNNFHNLTLLK